MKPQSNPMKSNPIQIESNQIQFEFDFWTKNGSLEQCVARITLRLVFFPVHLELKCVDYIES